MLHELGPPVASSAPHRYDELLSGSRSFGQLATGRILSASPINSEAYPTAASIERARRDALCPSERADAIYFDWVQVAWGIILAGGAYPVIVIALASIFGSAMIVWSFVTGPRGGPGVVDALFGLVFMWMYVIYGAIAGFIWSGLVTAITLPLVYLCAWSLELRQSIVWLGAFSGGLIGFVAAMPIVLMALHFDGEVWSGLILIAIGPGLATIIGQIGGAWGGTRSREIGPNAGWYNSSATAHSADRSTHAEPWVDPAEPPAATPGRWQFGIRHLLWVSVWFSLLLALIRLCRIPYELMLPLIMGWVAFQSASLWFGGRLLRRLAPWWLGRQARST